MDRILTTHVGSLIRPPALLELLTAMERGESYDEAAYEAVLDDAVADVVRRQAAAGIDVIDDGEMGKGNWITYLYGRVSGIESRLVPLEGAVMLPPSRDRQAFPEFYAQLDAQYARAMTNMLRVAEKDQDAESGLDMQAEGKYWYVHGADRVRRRPARSATSRASRPRSPGSTTRTSSSRSSRRRARTGCATSTTRARRSSSTRSPTRCTRSTRRSSTPASSSRSTTRCCCTSTTRSSRSAARWRTTAAGRSCASTRSSTRSAGFRRSGSATTSATGAGTARTPSTRRCAR